MNPPDVAASPPQPPSFWMERMLYLGLLMLAVVLCADGLVHLLPANDEWETVCVIGRVFVAVVAIGTHLTVLFTPKISRRVAIPLVFAAYWAAGGGFPIPLLKIDHPETIVAGIELAVGILGTLILLLPGFTPSLLRLSERPYVSGWNTAGVLAISVPLCLLLLFGGLMDGASWGIAKFSGGYMRIRTTGLVLEERRYVRNGEEVWLIGMMHIAQPDFYKNLFPTNGSSPTTIVLLEGVTDKEGKLKQGFSMNNVAGLLGLSSQHDAAIHVGENDDPTAETAVLAENQTIEWKNGMRLKRADIDVAEFRPETLLYLGEVGKVFSSTSLMELFKKMFDPKSLLANEQYQAMAFEDILDKRNVHLMKEIEASFPAYDRIIVPWGALHLPEVGTWLEKNGFQKKETVERLAVPFPGQRKKE